MKINRKIQNALIFVMYLTKYGRSTAGKVAEATGLSSEFLVQCIKPLLNAGLIGSRKGPGGGYFLNYPPSLYQVLAACEQPSLLRPADAERLLKVPEFGSQLTTLLEQLDDTYNMFAKEVMIEHLETEAEQAHMDTPHYGTIKNGEFTRD